MGHHTMNRPALVFLGLLAIAGHARAGDPEPPPAGDAAPPVTSEPPPVTSAQPSPPPTLPRPESVTFFSTATPGSLRVEGSGIEGDAGACVESCTLKLAPGNYRVVAPNDADGHAFGVNVPGASHVVLDPGSATLRGVGMGMIIVGGVAAFVGVVALYWDIDQRTRPERRGCVGNVCDAEAVEAQNQPYRQPSWVVPTMVGGAIGGVVALGGTAIYVAWRPSVRVTPLEGAVGARPRVAADGRRFRGLPGLGSASAGLELTGAF